MHSEGSYGVQINQASLSFRTDKSLLLDASSAIRYLDPIVKPC